MELLAQIVLGNQNGIAADSFVNTLAIERAAAGPASALELEDLADEIADLYRANHPANGQTASIGSHLGSQVSRVVGACQVNIYDISGKLELGPPDENGRRKPPPHGSPIKVKTFTMDPPSYANSSPSQIAAVVTLRSRTALESPVEDGSVRPRQRGTGRVYIGPLNEGAMVNANTQPKVSASFMDNVCAAFEGFQEAINGSGWALSVWSRTRGMLSVVTSVECDNSFDVIRSRKIKPTFRTKRVFDPVPALALGA